MDFRFPDFGNEQVYFEFGNADFVSLVSACAMPTISRQMSLQSENYRCVICHLPVIQKNASISDKANVKGSLSVPNLLVYTDQVVITLRPLYYLCYSGQRAEHHCN